MGHHQVTILIY